MKTKQLKKEDDEIINIRRCDLEGVILLATLGKKELVEAVWHSIDLMKR